MAQIQIAYLPRPGTQERWRRLCQEIAELHRDQFTASCQRAGITRMQVRLLQPLHGELLLLSVQAEKPHQALAALLSSECPFDHWLRGQLQILLGWDVQAMLAEPSDDLIFTWERSI